MNIKKYFLVLTYLLLSLIGINFYLRYKSNSDIADSTFYQKLFEIGYFNQSSNPYKKASILEIHPTNYFSLPLKKKDIQKINNQVFSLNKYGFRSNPYNSQNNKKKKCILFLGSSTAFGIGSSSDSLTIPAIINKKLGSDYYVYNLAIPSWKSRQELISLLDFVEKKESKKCTTVDTISLTGNTDLNTLDYLQKSSYYNEEHLRQNLYNAPIYFAKLEELIRNGTMSKNELRFNLRMAFNKLIENLFGELIEFSNINLYSKNKTTTKLSENKKVPPNQEFIFGQLNSFLTNQKNIHEITNNLGGNHLIALQPDLKNAKNDDLNWLKKNKILSKLINKETCLNILDLRKYFNEKQAKYKLNNELITMSLKDSINKKLFKNKDLNKHYMYDDSHLTNLGNQKLASIIYDTYLKNKTKKECSLGSNLK